MIKAEILLDSVSKSGVRLTTFVLTYPRFIHSEIMTHRVFSRNAASSRAIPVKKMIEDIRKEPAMPVYWGKNQSGMQAKEELDESTKDAAKQIWLDACEGAIANAEKLMALGLHKQIANRILETWFHMRTVVTASEFLNFYGLRRHPDAQPEFKALADCMWNAHEASTPQVKSTGEWHLPFVRDDEWWMDLDLLKKISVARCCRVSYLNLDGTNPDIEKDINLHTKLVESGHMSPFEHAACCTGDRQYYGNFRGWKQYRKYIPNEDVFGNLRKEQL